MARFTDRSIVITGAGSGIGRATAELLAAEGARLTLVDLDEKGLTDTRSELHRVASDLEAITVVADVTQEEQVAEYVRTAVDGFGRIDGFFNNAGIAAGETPVEDYPLERFRRLLDINATGAFLGLRAVVGVMRGQGSGAIVNTASVAGIGGVAGQIGYVASKHAAVGLTRTAALDCAAHGVRVNAVAPGGILTPMAERAMREAAGEDWQRLAEAAAQANPMKRIGRAEDVAPVAAFLLSDDAAFINGEVITVDGGQSVAS